jgi:hypothetical protein
MKLGQYEIKAVEFPVTMPENDKNCRQQSNRSSTGGQPKIRTARKKPEGPSDEE